METYWIDKIDKKNFYSLDDLKGNILFSYKILILVRKLDILQKSYSLQDKSNYNILRKRF